MQDKDRKILISLLIWILEIKERYGGSGTPPQTVLVFTKELVQLRESHTLCT